MTLQDLGSDELGPVISFFINKSYIAFLKNTVFCTAVK